MLRVGIGDIHLSGYQSDQIVEDGLTQRLSRIMRSLTQIGEYCRSNNIKYFEIWGDLINDKDLIYTVAQTAFKNFLVEYSDIEFIIISGNHDLSSTGNNQASAISVFSDYPNVTIVDDVYIEGNRTYLAYSHNIFDKLKSIKDTDILISHFGISEAMLQSGMSISTNVKMSDLKRFKLVLLGHYHKPQHISNGDMNLYYSGNICHLNWNDKNEQKRFLVYDDETLEVQSVDLVGFKEYKEYVIRNKDESSDILVEAEKSKNNGHMVRVKKLFDGDMVAPSDLVIVESKQEMDVTDRGIDLTQTKDEKLKNYMNIKNIDSSDQDDYIKILHDNDII
jgi:DNA repair exonuclease SbcCD nuclease subunit